METSAIFGLGKLLGHHCLALNAIVANRVVQQFSKDGKAAVEKLIVAFFGESGRDLKQQSVILIFV
ncbi:MAG: hypothetical protein NVV59_01455 [Chitinophagaceae bacterium]|nr:hypothetical protein [Chitinophagaceae bacterium]